MAQTNRKREQIYTHEGGKAKHTTDEQALRKAVMCCMLWEKQFYENGIDIANRIKSLVPKVNAKYAALVAYEARNEMHVRHAPLLIAREMVKYASHKPYVADLLYWTIQRPDELMEIIAMYWEDGKKPIPAQIKRGIGLAFNKFDEYQFAKYNNKSKAIKLRDVMFLCHPKPETSEKEKLFKKIANDSLDVPDTWEANLSSGEDKKETWSRLMREKKLGAMALLRNLAGMVRAGVDESQIKQYIKESRYKKVLPFRFITAANHAPDFEDELGQAMLQAIEGFQKIPGQTVLLVDVSGSMSDPLSSRSEMTRRDAAAGVAMLLREICEDVKIYSFSMKLVKIPPRRAFALKDAIMSSQIFSGTPLGIAVDSIYKPTDFFCSNIDGRTLGVMPSNYYDVSYNGQGLKPDRLIVLTDEQSSTKVPDPRHGKGYMINIASCKNGVGYGAWTHIDGWSENVIKFIQNIEENGLS